MKWIRLYTKVATDPKVQQLPDWLFKRWINLLLLAGERDSPVLPGGVENSWRCFQLPSTNRQRHIKNTTRWLSRLHEDGLLDIENGFYRIHNWEKYQYVSDSSTVRVKRFRERSRNVSETPQSRADKIRTEQSSTGSVLNSGGDPTAAEPPPAALPLSQIIPFAAAAAAAAPNPIRDQAAKALLRRYDDIRHADNPEGLALTILQDFGISPPPRKKKHSANSRDDYNELAAEIARRKHMGA